MLPEPEMNTNLPPNQLLEKVWQSLKKRDIRQAVDSSNILVRDFPNFAPGWNAASHVAQLFKKPKQALTAIERALKIEPGNIDWQLHRVGCLLMCGDNAASGKTVVTLVSQSGNFNPAQLSNLAFLCNRLEMHDDAARLYQSLIQREPKNGAHWYNLATIQRFKGEIEDAESSLEKAIRLNSEDFDAYELRSDLRRQSKESNHLSELRSLLKKGIKSPAGEVRVCYALAKELEDIGDSQASFDALSRGATLRRKHINYRIKDDLQTIDAIIKTFDPGKFTAHEKANSSTEPVFIIGLPRSGTTLAERMLGSHSAVFAAGELNNFSIQMVQQVHRQNGATVLSREAMVHQSAKLDFENLGKAYLDSTRPLTGHTQHFIDKMPLNFMYAGLIHLGLPHAKIIHLTRHPMDSCYSIYKRLFQDGYPWSYDLNEIASYYLAYRRLMAHWHDVMPGVIYDVAYEDLVSSPDTQIRNLVNHCGLTWESQCLRFHESSAVTTTASAAQVRSPVHTKSVNLWREYQQKLAPLANQLRAGGIQFD
jgi:tetratricopeptide (TPR) repeat protein